MSALTIGRDRYLDVSRRGTTAADFASRVTRWIPGDVLALFAAAVTLFSETDGQTSASEGVGLLILFTVLTPIVVLLGVWADAARAYRRGDFINAGLALLAFVIWSLAVPDSGWEEWSLVDENRQSVVILAAAAGLVFGLFATGVEKRIIVREDD